MIVCHCRAVSDRAIRKAVRDGARTRRDVARACSAAARCGSCGPAIDEIISSELEAEAAPGFAVLTELAVSA